MLRVDSCLGMGSKKKENIFSKCSKLFSVFVFRTALELGAGRGLLLGHSWAGLAGSPPQGESTPGSWWPRAAFQAG